MMKSKIMALAISILGAYTFAFSTVYAETKAYHCIFKQKGATTGDSFSFSYSTANKQLKLKNYPEGDGVLNEKLRLGEVLENKQRIEFNIETIFEGYADTITSYTLRYKSLSFSSSNDYYNKEGSLEGHGASSEGACIRIENWQTKDNNKTKSTNKPVAVIIATPQDKKYKSRIIEGAKHPINFAKNHIISTWGCGTQCEQGVAINAITGKVTWLPFTAGISFMTDPNWAEEKVEEIFKFKKNSNAITIYAYNLDKNDGYNVHHYMLKNDQFILVSRSKP